MKEFEVTGDIEENKGRKKFSMTISANSANHAAEKALSTIGSKHKKTRRKVFVKEIKEKK